MAVPPKRTEVSFIVRLWREAGATAADPMRGGAQDLETGDRFFFSNLADLGVYLQKKLAAGALRDTGSA